MDNHNPFPNFQDSPEVVEMQKEIASIEAKLAHAFENNWEGYLLDEDDSGNKYHGNKGFTAYNRDQMRLNMLTRQVSEARQTEDRRQRAVDGVKSALRGMSESVLKQGLNAYPKLHHPKITENFNAIVAATPDWSAYSSKESLEQALEWAFAKAAHDVLKAGVKPGKSAPPAGDHYAGDEADPADTGGDTGPEKNEYGFSTEDGISYDLTERYKEIKANRGGILGGRRA